MQILQLPRALSLLYICRDFYILYYTLRLNFLTRANRAFEKARDTEEKSYITIQIAAFFRIESDSLY